MSPYQEYLELFDYFGRGGMVRLDRVAFEACDGEFTALVERLGRLEETEMARLVVLKTVLFRDRPTLAQIRRTGG
ncbi:MAG: hypothetical protein IT371_17675 [Deltaproteobacteria bacterium]|nr:hypothetical protein [Deltaproteobacteria bacterium]